MEISVELEDLRKKKIFVATPMYGGQCHGMYTKSSCDLAKIGQAYNMDIKMFYLFNESLINSPSSGILKTEKIFFPCADSPINSLAAKLVSIMLKLWFIINNGSGKCL